MIKYSKYHGCGNNFIIVDYDDIKGKDISRLAKHACDVYTGIGADGFIAVKKDPLEMIFYNCDGSRAEMCGNGIRCLGQYCLDQKIENNDLFDVVTLGGLMHLKKVNDGFLVNMGKPKFDKDLLKIESDVDLKHIHVAGVEVSSVFMGTIHTVVFVDNIDNKIVEKLGNSICNDKLYKEKTNVNFVEIDDRDNMIVKTYERGVGITKACGTGCCASFVIARLFNKINEQVKIHLELGTLMISENQNGEILMCGPAVKIADGQMIEEETLC